MARIILTGAAGHLGRATADRFASDGHRLARIARRTPEKAPGGELWFACDLADTAAVEAAVAGACEALGGIDAAVHAAGAFGYHSFGDGLIEEWRRLHSANVESALNLLSAAIPRVADGGAIVLVGAAAAERAGAGMAPYAAAKSAIARLVEALAAELAPRRIRANSVLPRIIDTPANRAAMPDADFSSWTSPAAIADVIAFLIGDEARAINGAHIPVVNGG